MVSRRQFLRGDLSGSRTSPGPTAEAAGPRIHIAGSCIAFGNAVCRSCGDACAAGAIRFRPRLGGAAVPEVDAAKCTACGACVAPCPVAAITLTR